MAEDEEACLMGFVGRDRIRAGIPLVVLCEPRKIRFVQQPGTYHLADVAVGGVFGELQPSSGVEEARKILSVLGPRSQCIRHVLERDDRGYTVIYEELAHVVFPMHMGIEQSGNDEFSAEIEQLRARRRGGVCRKHLSNGIALDQ